MRHFSPAHWLPIFILLLIGSLKAQTPELVVQTGHSSAVFDAVISPDRKYLLSVSLNELILWDFYGRELLKFDVQGAGISALAFLPDGKRFLTGHTDGSVSLMNLKGEQLRSYQWHQAQVASLDIAPDGQTIMSAGWDRIVQLWTIDGGKRQSFREPDGRIGRATFSSNGKSILTTTHSFKGVKLWDLNGRLLHHFSPNAYTGACFSPDGQYILTWGNNVFATLWDVSGRKVRDFKTPHTKGAFSPDGEHILLSEGNGTIYAIDFTGSPLLEYKGHNDYIYILRTYPEADLILSGDEAGNLKLWRSSRHLRDFGGHSPPIYDADLSPDGQYFAFGGGDTRVKLWRIRDQELKIFTGHQSSVNALSFLPDGKKLLSGSESGTAVIWDLDGKQLDVFRDPGMHHIGDVAHSPDGRWMGASSRSGLVKLWSVPEHRTVDLVVIDSISGMTYDEFNATDTGIGFSPSSTYNALAFSPDGKLVAVAYGPKVVLFDRNGTALRYMNDFPGVEDVRFSPDGHLLLLGCSDGSIQLCELSGSVIRNLKEQGAEKVNTVAFSADGQKILSGHEDGMIRCWEHSGRLKRSFEGHGISIEAVSLTADGEHFLTASLDGTLKLWSWQTGELLATLLSLSGRENAWVQINPENYYCGTKDLSEFVHFKIGLQAYSYEQFDLRLNRPDKVLESLLPFGVDPELIRRYRQAYRKRLERYGFTEAMLSDDFQVPECFIANINDIPPSTSESTVRLSIEAVDTLQLLDRLNVYVNNVPIYGISGIDLRGQNTGAYQATLSIPLAQGNNKIEVSALNQGGGESLKATTYVTYEAPDASSDLYVLAIGISDYQTTGKDLQYAAKDARDIAALYQSATGFAQVYTKILTDGQATKSNILALRAWLEQSRVDDQVLLYVSGHGLIDDNYDFYYATHDIDFANPAEKGILYDEIEGLLDGIPARKKLLLMDACHSGEYDADAPPLTAAQKDSLAQKGVSFKGFSKGDEEGGPTLGLQNSFEMMQQLFADLRRGSGATVITSSAGVQVSYEDEDWQNGAFTYAFLYGLQSMKADADGDGQVTASEIQAFVAEYVPRLTEGLQVPTFRRENLEYDFRVW